MSALRHAIARERETLRKGLYPIYIIATSPRSVCRAGLKALVLAYREELREIGLAHLVDRAAGNKSTHTTQAPCEQ